MKQFIVFGLGEEDFGIDIKNVVEILKYQKVRGLPNLPDFISGIITVRGDVIALIDMRKRFGIRFSQSKNERIILIRAEGEKVGLVVDAVREIASFSNEEMTLPPAIFKGLKTEYLEGIAKKKGSVVILLSIESLLSAEEKIILKESTETAIVET
ncbi:MAG: chemotaxis protein CheW [Nitrospirae bacterium]|nr:chemotaxis protein CheW [Nitrospirota bacterium]